jgi:hypothetical protein
MLDRICLAVKDMLPMARQATGMMICFVLIQKLSNGEV